MRRTRSFKRRNPPFCRLCPQERNTNFTQERSRRQAWWSTSVRVRLKRKKKQKTPNRKLPRRGAPTLQPRRWAPPRPSRVRCEAAAARRAGACVCGRGGGAGGGRGGPASLPGAAADSVARPGLRKGSVLSPSLHCGRACVEEQLIVPVHGCNWDSEQHFKELSPTCGNSWPFLNSKLGKWLPPAMLIFLIPCSRGTQKLQL